jgi:hypothetical protein
MTTNRAVPRLALLGAAAAALSACGGGGGGSTTVVPPATVPAPFAYMFGNGFGADFTAAANSTPAPLSGNEINPVSLTASPIPFPAGTTGSN